LILTGGQVARCVVNKVGLQKKDISQAFSRSNDLDCVTLEIISTVVQQAIK
jgi:uncharacterized protein YqfA (UPF0365 family)